MSNLPAKRTATKDPVAVTTRTLASPPAPVHHYAPPIEHTGTACTNVLTHNPQAGDASHSAPPAQQNLFEVGAAMCGLS